jgi:dihydrolipoamide dehydrogenase
LVKVVCSPKGTILGASIVASRAGEMIHELALAIQLKAKASDVAGMVHAFPTWSEAVKVACMKVR